MNIILMAGGGGTRLWPLSRQKQPKQFLDLGSGKTLLEHAWDRAARLTNHNNIYVATLEEYRERTQEVLPNISSQNIFTEPAKRDTAPAFALVAARLAAQGEGEKPAMFMWADHIFTNEDDLLDDLSKAPGLLERHPGSVIIVGHRPTTPDVNFGYIKATSPVPGEEENIRMVDSFKEKPNRKTAEEYLEAGTYFWNMAYISLTPNFLLDELSQYEPDLMEKIEEVQKLMHSQDKQRADQIYSSLKKQAIDYVLLEKTPKIIAITGDYGWSDVGNWAAVQEVFGAKGDHMPHGHHVHIQSNDNYIYNATNSTVSLLGTKGLIVVVTEDAILITTEDNAPKVKDVVSHLQEKGKTDVL